LVGMIIVHLLQTSLGMNKFLLICLALSGLPGFIFGQNDMKNMPGMNPKQPAIDSARSRKPAAETDNEMGSMNMNSPAMNMEQMSSAFSTHLPMNRNGSGTAWLPDASPVYGWMFNTNKWMFMLHGDIFVRYNRQDINNAGHRGGEKWDAPDMLMLMGQRKAGKNGLFHFNIMLSTDALIAGGSGYPLLFQTGESWQGKPLVDRQHPHDLFSELSLSYAYNFSEKTDLYLYAGYPGEPALGPVTFMHRPSGSFNPDAPLGHHWQDATHITFGVTTLGLRYGKFKLEGSLFTGREPDENRYNFDKPLFDSRSVRLSFNPSANWALQVSHGFLKSPEAQHPDENIRRTTASAIAIYPLGLNSYFSSTLLWGQNVIEGQNSSNSALAEATIKISKLAVYGRYEWVQKSGEELNLDRAIFDGHTQFAVNAITIGAGYDLLKAGPIIVAGGAQLSLYPVDARLTDLYGHKPLAAEIYLHIYPAIMK
jgi:hypothetical protein